MSFKVGDIVVCIDSAGITECAPITEGDYYTIRHSTTSRRYGNGEKIVYLNERTSKNNIYGIEWAYRASRFILAESEHSEKSLSNSIQESK